MPLRAIACRGGFLQAARGGECDRLKRPRENSGRTDDGGGKPEASGAPTRAPRSTETGSTRSNTTSSGTTGATVAASLFRNSVFHRQPAEEFSQGESCAGTCDAAFAAQQLPASARSVIPPSEQWMQHNRSDKTKPAITTNDPQRRRTGSGSVLVRRPFIYRDYAQSRTGSQLPRSILLSRAKSCTRLHDAIIV